MPQSAALRVAAILLVFAGLGPWEALAQNTSTAAPTTVERPRTYRTTGSRIAIARSIRIEADEEVSETVVVVGGSLRVDGRVRDGVVVVGGNLHLGPQADVSGDVVLVGGQLTRADGAQLRGSIDNISFGHWGRWSLGGLSIPTLEFGDVGRWLSLMGTVFRLSLLALLMAMVLVLARAPVARVGRAAGSEPFKAFAVGLIAAVLFVPALILACIALIVTIVGIPLVVLLVPLALLGLFVAMILGFTGLAYQLGAWVDDRLGVRAHSAFLAATIGTLLILGPTLLARLVGVMPEPVRYTGFALLLAGITVEAVIWTMGLGAVVLTGFGRYSTAPPPVPPAVQNGAVIVPS